MSEVGDGSWVFPAAASRCAVTRRPTSGSGNLFGKAAGLPLWQLLGGLCRDKIRIYDTCASAGYTRMVRAGTNSLLLGPRIGGRAAIPWTTLAAQHQRPAEVARSLLESPALPVAPQASRGFVAGTDSALASYVRLPQNHAMSGVERTKERSTRPDAGPLASYRPDGFWCELYGCESSP